MEGYKNYGDKNFLEYGILVSEESATEFRIVMCRPYGDVDPEDGQIHYQFSENYVDINDSWIDKKAVESFCGSYAKNDPAHFAIACIEYYGPENFGADGNSYQYDWRNCTKEDVYAQIGAYVMDSYDDINFDGIPYDLSKLNGNEYITDMPEFVRNHFKEALVTLDLSGDRIDELMDGRLDGLSEIGINFRAYTDNLGIDGRRFSKDHEL